MGELVFELLGFKRSIEELRGAALQGEVCQELAQHQRQISHNRKTKNIRFFTTADKPLAVTR
jgi:hypothetical protein